MKLSNKFIKFMSGRYGPDNLWNFLFKIYIALFIINLFINSSIINTLELLIVITMLYRFFSKNIYQRRKENQEFLKLKKKVTKPFLDIKRNINDQNNVYKKCKHCKKILKLPIPEERGIKKVKCPNCKKRIKVLVLKKQKVEFIKGSV